jgi:hypothetical protein
MRRLNPDKSTISRMSHIRLINLLMDTTSHVDAVCDNSENLAADEYIKEGLAEIAALKKEALKRMMKGDRK